MNSYLELIEKSRNIGKNPLVRKAVRYIDEHISQKLTVRDIAREIGVTESHLSRAFKKEKGLTLITYITTKKMHLAQDLLENKKLTMLEISLMVGYDDANYFTRQFKKTFQVSPSKYQNQLIKK